MPRPSPNAANDPTAPYLIQSGVPLPPRKTAGGAITGALRTLAREGKVGDCVLIPGKRAGQIGAYCASAAGGGWTAARTVDGGVRVWKIAEPKAKA